MCVCVCVCCFGACITKRGVVTLHRTMPCDPCGAHCCRSGMVQGQLGQLGRRPQCVGCAPSSWHVDTRRVARSERRQESPTCAWKLMTSEHRGADAVCAVAGKGRWKRGGGDRFLECAAIEGGSHSGERQDGVIHRQTAGARTVCANEASTRSRRSVCLREHVVVSTRANRELGGYDATQVLCLLVCFFMFWLLLCKG